MSDKFSKETIVCNLLLEYLKINDHTVVQFISPGGQATFSIRYECSTNKLVKTVFPDLISFKQNTIYIGEVKEKFSASDQNKLLDIKNSDYGNEKIKSLVKRVKKIDTKDFDIVYWLIHGDIDFIIASEISQLVLTPNESIFREGKNDF